MIRARIQWINEGERPSKYFCKLENKNFVEKTIKKVELNDGTLVTDQKKILMSVRDFYEKLFKKTPEKRKTFEECIKKIHFLQFLKLNIMSC